MVDKGNQTKEKKSERKVNRIMRCGYCGFKAKVENTRGTGKITMRCYLCPNCNRKFYTQEVKVNSDEGRQVLHKIANENRE